MRLSDIRGERLLDVIADIAEPVANIVLDDGVAAYFKREKCPEGVDPKQFTVRRIAQTVPHLIKGHKQDIIRILAALEGVPAREYEENLTPASLIGSVMELCTDEELLAFLSQYAETGAQAPAGDA